MSHTVSIFLTPVKLVNHANRTSRVSKLEIYSYVRQFISEVVWDRSVDWNPVSAMAYAREMVQAGLGEAAGAIDTLWGMPAAVRNHPRFQDERARVTRFAFQIMAWESLCLHTKIMTQASLSQHKNTVCQMVHRVCSTGLEKEGEPRRNIADLIDRAVLMYTLFNNMGLDEGIDLCIEGEAGAEAANYRPSADKAKAPAK